LEGFALAAYLWFLHLCVASPISLLVWFFGRRRAQWFKREPIILVVPFSVWVLLSSIYDGGKSLTNLVSFAGVLLWALVPILPE